MGIGNAKLWHWGSKPMPEPNANGFASQWNIGFRLKKKENETLEFFMNPPEIHVQ